METIGTKGETIPMKRLLSLMLLLVMLCMCVPGHALIERNEYLDVAFTCLEKGNPFLERYNELTGADIQPIVDCGVPYFFGGQNVDNLFKVMKLREDSTYGKTGEKQLVGFDCIGFTRWIQDEVGDKRSPSLYDMLNKWGQYGKYMLNDLKEETDFTKVAQQLEIGDFLVGNIKGRHILMFMGTLRDYGYTEDTAGDLGAYLDYPLFINCGNDPNYIARTQKYLEENDKAYADPNRGGVTVSIAGLTYEGAPHMRDDGAKPFYYYDLNGYQVSVYDLTVATSFRYWRTVESDKTR